MDLLMGIDLGTTRVKTLLFDLEGGVAGQAGRNVALLRLREGWVEQDAEELWQAVVGTAREAVTQAGPQARVLGLSLSTQTGTLVPVDESGHPLRTAFGWMDWRGTEVIEGLRQVLDTEEIHRLGGWELSGSSVLAHIEWLRQREPAHYEAARYFLQLNDFIIYRLTGQPDQDPSVAGYSGLYDIVGNRWNERALSAVGITPRRLPLVVPAGEPVGRVTAGAAAQIGLSPETVVVNGPHDQYAAALGAGVTEPGQVLLSCGTAWVLLVTTAEPAWDSGAAISRHAVPGRWGAICSMGAVGTTVEWYVDTILAPAGGFAGGARSEAFEVMNRQLSQVPIGARGLFCSPVGGGRARVGGGVLWGLTAEHGKDEIGRAVLEGITFELREMLEGMRSAQMPIRSLVMVGGAAQSSCWPQIVADVTGLEVTVPVVQEAAARGAALLAGIGLGRFTAETGFEQARSEDSLFSPQESIRGEYDELFQRYRATLQGFRDALATASADRGVPRGR
jgi:xylulokinase